MSVGPLGKVLHEVYGEIEVIRSEILPLGPHSPSKAESSVRNRGADEVLGIWHILVHAVALTVPGIKETCTSLVIKPR
jgi:hypothetical protein